MNKQTCQMNGKQENTNILVENYCYKCFSLLGDKRVKDHEGHEYCDTICRKEFYLENNKETNARFNNWIGRD